MNKSALTVQEQWAEDWLRSVADGSNTMSQRKITSIEKHVSLSTVKRIAKRMGIHLLLIEDDKGNELMAASTKPVKVIC